MKVRVNPVAERLFHRALQFAEQAEARLIPGEPVLKALRPLVKSAIEVIRGIAYVFVEDPKVNYRAGEEKH